MSAVAQLSEQIVLSQSPGLTNSVDLRLQSTDRLEKLHRLAFFIATNGKLRLFSQNALRKLSADAELIAAAVDIWEYYNVSLSTDTRKGRTSDSLAEAISTVLSGHLDAQWQGDLVRLFFRQELPLLNEVIANLQIDASEKHGISQITKLIRVNQVILVSRSTHVEIKMRFAEVEILLCDDSSVPFKLLIGIGQRRRNCTILTFNTSHMKHGRAKLPT